MCSKADIAEYTAIAAAGYNSSEAKSPYLATSSNDSAWLAGKWLRHTGWSAPHGKIAPGRGSKFHINGMVVQIDYHRGRYEVTRVA
jgi:hypothetical protein